MKHSVLTLSLLVLLVGCMTAPAVPPRMLRIEIGAGKIAEECFVLGQGERVDYQFSSSIAVDFNLHAHRGGEIYMPVDNKQTRSQSGTYSAPRREDYCMMWTNNGAVPAHLSGEWRKLSR